MGGRKKRYDETETESLRSSSLRRDSILVTKTGHQTTQRVSVGCMSGIFQFMSKYHTRRKLITSGNRPVNEATKKPSQKQKHATCQSNNERTMSQEVILEIPRSPSIPAEIRRQPPPTTSSLNSPTASEKRRRLLGALEKCDEDLQALRRVIESVRGVQTPRTPPPPRRGGATVEEEEEEEPSPVSVLDVRSPTNNRACSKPTKQEKCLQHQLTRQYTSTKRSGDEDNIILKSSLQVPAKIQPHLLTIVPTPTSSHTLSRRWSSATRECVMEVCNAVEMGQRLEVGSLILVLEDIIFRDLVDDIINELDLYHKSSTYYVPRLPIETSKRKLSF